MKARIVAVDFAGTLVKPGMIEQAGILRDEVFDRQMAARSEHGEPEKLYAKNRDAIQKLTGINKDMIIAYREPDGGDVELSGEQFQNVLSTALFGLGLLSVAKEHGQDIYVEGMLEELSRIKRSGYDLAIVSGVRRDLISGVLAVTGIRELFEHIQGQPATLGMSNEQQLKDLQAYAEIAYVIGDKLSDLDPAHTVGAQAVFVTWGHPSGGEEALADHTADSAADLKDIIT